MEKPRKIQSRTWGIIIPCEWENHMRIVYKAKQVAKYYYWIRHDNDMYTEPDENVDNPHDVGELKKPHIHLLMTFSNSRDLSTVQNYFREFEQLRENSYEKIANAFGAKRYLVHADNPEKHRYDMLEVETNDRLFSNVFIEKMSAAETLGKLLDAYDGNGRTMREYCEKFSSVLVQMNAWQMSACLSHYRREWRIKNMFKEYMSIQKSVNNDLPVVGDLPF